MNLFKSILKFSTDKVNSYGAQYDAFWIFMLIFYLTPPYTWSYWQPGPYPNDWVLALRIFSFFLGGCIAIHRLWPKNLKIYLPVFWHFTLLFWCPFRTIFILLNSTHSTGFSFYGIMGIFLFAILVDEISYTIILFLSFIITPLFFYSTGGLATDFPTNQAIFQTLWMIATITFFKWGFFRQQRIEANQKIKCYQNVANTVAHEMRVPLASIILATKGLKNKINCEDTAESQKIICHIDTLASHAQITIDMLLYRLGKVIPKDEYANCSLKDCIEEALIEYPFEHGEKEKIAIESLQDIIFFGPKRLIIHVIFNLIKNSLFAIHQAQKGKILITIHGDSNQLKFKDTANGISQKNSKKLFKELFTTKTNGTGMGLFFCKQTMAHINGNMTFSSKPGSHTEFVLYFPKYSRELNHEYAPAL